jgi:2,4-dienoyl-CoA reductase-like NADH-dependent reductase (Old Yellow Enzyme family)
LRESYVEAAVRAERAGFDAVELHGAHGYLLNQFLSPLTNRRSDAYGGSDRGRAQFPLEVLEAVRKALDRTTILLYRLGADDLLPGGLTIEATSRFSFWLEETGVDLIDVSGGMSGVGIVDEKPGFFRTHSRAIKDRVSIPVMVTGGVKTPEFAEEILGSGDADIVGVGRALLANPRWAREALERLED